MAIQKHSDLLAFPPVSPPCQRERLIHRPSLAGLSLERFRKKLAYGPNVAGCSPGTVLGCLLCARRASPSTMSGSQQRELCVFILFLFPPPFLLSPCQSSTQEIGEEVEEGVVYSISLRKVQLHHTANKGQRWLGVSEGSGMLGVDGAHRPEAEVNRSKHLRTIKAGTLEKLVEYLVSAFKGNDSTYVTIFLCTYRAFASTKQVLDLLLNRYGKLHSQAHGEHARHAVDERLELKNTISSILGAWLDQYSEDFRKPPDYTCLKQLIIYVRLNIPGSDLERRARILFTQFQHQERAEGEAEVVDRPCCPLRLEENDSPGEGKVDFLSFSPEMAAEQFTLMDAELFKKVVPYHCLGCIWSQRDKKGKEHLAPTIRATVSQFNSVTNCVIATCLGDRTLKPLQRARVVERWIDVARECRILKNFSSLRAILSALQCNAIHRLKKTWDEVSR
ncbi:hypothetical protein JD844_004549 [Phrynosoma platyrhinos]|uniref:Ral guanine nucleotide dissociation stimulator-like 1 n=1 Tax=Phrynosoma platyrhinos TaxID=52577 RepID=A0ABQ7SDF7_PHRPL|nr:hypothetical protein JD844_004549 [Phrynosoma platyrhinos]